MLRLWLIMILAVVTASLSLPAGGQSKPECKPVEYFGVKGCEPLPDRTCPPGHHLQVVNPPDPRMKAPSRLMCVPDEPAKKDKTPQPPPPANQPEK